MRGDLLSSPVTDLGASPAPIGVSGCCFCAPRSMTTYHYINPSVMADKEKYIEEFREAVAILTDGKLDKRDIRAVVMLLGSLSGFASAAYLALQGLSVL